MADRLPEGKRGCPRKGPSEAAAAELLEELMSARGVAVSIVIAEETYVEWRKRLTRDDAGYD